jgi:hypothetical protein
MPLKTNASITSINNPNGAASFSIAGNEHMDEWKALNDKEVQADQKNSPSNFGISTTAEKEQARLTAEWGIFKKNSAPESIDNPDPLLSDIISSLDPASKRRTQLLNLRFANHGLEHKNFGLDSVSPDLYSEIQRLNKQSSFLFNTSTSFTKSVGESSGGFFNSSADDTPFKQRWQAASIAVGSAVGSSANTDFSVKKSQFGPDASLPQSTINELDKFHPNIADKHQSEKTTSLMQKVSNMPSKICGSLRQLLAFADKILRIPFDILADAYQGLNRLLQALNELIGAIIGKIIEWVIGLIGGLLDTLLPDSLVGGFFAEVGQFAEGIGGIADLFGGFGAVGTICHQLAGIGQAWTNPALNKFEKISILLKGVAVSMDAIAAMTEVPPGCINTFAIKMQKRAKKFRQWGTLAGILGKPSNIRFAIDIPLPAGIAKLVAAMRTPGGLLMAILPAPISNAITRFMEMCCGAGYVGDGGYSGASYFGDTLDHFYEKAISLFPVHTSQFSPNFNKESVPIGSYKRTGVSLGIADSKFVNSGVNFLHGLANFGSGSTKDYKIIKTPPAEKTLKAQSYEKVMDLKITPW